MPFVKNLLHAFPNAKPATPMPGIGFVNVNSAHTISGLMSFDLIFVFAADEAAFIINEVTEFLC